MEILPWSGLGALPLIGISFLIFVVILVVGVFIIRHGGGD